MLDIYYISAGLYDVNIFALPSSNKKIKRIISLYLSDKQNRMLLMSQTGKFNEAMLLLLENYLRPFKILIA